MAIFCKRGDSFMEKTRTVCIIGAGVAGIAAIKHSLEEGLAPICFEKDSDLGGIWNYHDVPKNGDPSLYKSCCINTSKAMTCYSDFPIPKEFPNFMHHRFFKKILGFIRPKFQPAGPHSFRALRRGSEKSRRLSRFGRLDRYCTET